MRRALWNLRGGALVVRRFPLRSALTVLSAGLGVACSVCAVNYALCGRQKVVDQLSRLGANVLNVTPQASRSVAGRSRTGSIVTTLTLADYRAVRREVPLFARSSAISTRALLIKAGDLAKKNCVVLGVEPDYMAIKTWRVAVGNLFDESDLRGLARVAVLGSTVARDLFGADPPVGARILINRVPFQVVGVMTERGQALDAGNEDDQVYVPLTTAMRRLANADYLSGIVLSVNRWEEMDRAAAGVRDLLRQRHVRIGKQPDDFQVQNQKELIETRAAASDRLLFFVRWIALSALIVSGLGVLAMGWMGVKERTGEIGSRRALGATRGDVFLQFVTEAVILSLAGCGCGLILAIEAAPVIARWVNQPAVFDIPSASWACGCAIGLNLVFGLLPAHSASRLDPIQALRFE